MSRITHLFTVVFIGLSAAFSFGQEVPITNYSINADGQVELEVNSSTDMYYILNIRHDITADFELATSLTLGTAGTTTISEPLSSYPLEHYQVLGYPTNAPNDTDNDGVDDLSEFADIPEYHPLNAAQPVPSSDGYVSIDDTTTFQELSVQQDTVQWSEYLNGKEFVKFIILDFNTAQPKVYYINTNVHPLHADFANTLGVDHLDPGVRKGHIIYHPTIESNNGTQGTYAFNYSNADGFDFETVQRTHELLAATMPYLNNNLSYLVNLSNEDDYQNEFALYDNSRIPVIFEADIYADIDYWGLNQTEGYGFFRKMELDEVPGARDIVLYESLPNSLPRVGGIMTSVVQTPLSHVNLRAIQDNIPNAFIRDPLSIDSIADLLNHYIYFDVRDDHYTIREASIDEVNEWYENLRPDTEQTPPLNLNYRSILPLSEISFSMFDGYGAKCTNVATMRTFGFPEGTIPNGFGVPFYFYQEFMQYNNFFEDVEFMLNHPDFIADRSVRDEMLDDFRDKIKAASMPGWMLDELASMHSSFPTGTSIRCRSSTNNEDLPGFSGAGLYDSKTQHPIEGHISKSIKQVYASLWNLRGF